ncbi:hypothetical protein [Candidatus Binatus soli]|jgi:hypothetical protein|uniref:hypothetical protein n=1 Tax=Candidatus Binatus soli TaxID=1953413 RepID=UPI003D14F833
MRRYKGGKPAKDGFYLKKGELEIVTVEGENGRLPGGIESEYIKVPDVLFVPLALIRGVLFVIFLPYVALAISALVLG